MCSLLLLLLKAHVIPSLQPHHTGTTLHLQAYSFHANPDSLSYCQITNQAMCCGRGFINSSACACR